MTAYAYGYSGSRRTLAQLNKNPTWYRLDPEFRRRLLALFDEGQRTGNDVGIGTGYRSSARQAENYAQDPGRFAPPGRSYHEIGLAADLVGDIYWAGEVAARFGLHDFSHVNNEAWHFQPVEVPNARRNYDPDLHDLEDAPAVPGVDLPRFDPANRLYSLWPVGDKDHLKQGDDGDEVLYLQGVLKHEVSRFAAWFLATHQHDSEARRLYLTAARDTCAKLTIDGDFGPQTSDAVEYVQWAFSETRYDGRYVGGLGLALGEVNTNQTWPFIDSVADGSWK